MSVSLEDTVECSAMIRAENHSTSQCVRFFGKCRWINYVSFGKLQHLTKPDSLLSWQFSIYEWLRGTMKEIILGAWNTGWLKLKHKSLTNLPDPLLISSSYSMDHHVHNDCNHPFVYVLLVNKTFIDDLNVAVNLAVHLAGFFGYWLVAWIQWLREFGLVASHRSFERARGSLMCGGQAQLCVSNGAMPMGLNDFMGPMTSVDPWNFVLLRSYFHGT